jgi:hypothetical protein
MKVLVLAVDCGVSPVPLFLPGFAAVAAGLTVTWTAGFWLDAPVELPPDLAAASDLLGVAAATLSGSAVQTLAAVVSAVFA